MGSSKQYISIDIRKPLYTLVDHLLVHLFLFHDAKANINENTEYARNLYTFQECLRFTPTYDFLSSIYTGKIRAEFLFKLGKGFHAPGHSG